MRSVAGIPAAVLSSRTGAIPGIGRRAAGQLARSELSKPAYHRHPSVTERVLGDVLGWLARIYHTAGTLPGGWWGAVALAGIAVIVAATVLFHMGPIAAPARGRRPMAPHGGSLGASGHREQAHLLAQDGEYGAALCECLRAIAAELDERGVLVPRSGRTADEFAEEAGLALPAHADALREAARRFDEVRYGKRAGTQAGYARLSELDTWIRADVTRVLRPGAASSVVRRRMP